jgi:hypothetical protein
MRIVAWFVLCISLCAGCRDTSTESRAQRPEKKPSGTRRLIEGVTGKAAVEQGKTARDALKNVSKTRDRDLQDVLGEE